LFEAGAIAKLTSVGRAIVLRIDLKPAEITGPLSQFQSLSLEQEDIWKMVVTINKAGSSSVSESTLRITFNALWPDIEAELKAVANTATDKTTPERSSHALLEEILALTRRQDSSYQHISSYLASLENRIQWAVLTTPSNPLSLSPNALMAAGHLGSRLYPNPTPSLLNPTYRDGLVPVDLKPVPPYKFPETDDENS
jgi:hypothetical protein